MLNSLELIDKVISFLCLTPLSRFVEGLTPDTKKLVYDTMKADENADTPLTKRWKEENVTNSPADMTCLQKPDFFAMLDRNYVEMPKVPKSPTFAEYRKGVYRAVLGNAYVECPLAPLQIGDIVTKVSPAGTQTESSQVAAFRKFIEWNRLNYCETYSVPGHGETGNSQCDEVKPIQASQSTEVDWRDLDEFNSSGRNTFDGKR